MGVEEGGEWLQAYWNIGLTVCHTRRPKYALFKTFCLDYFFVLGSSAVINTTITHVWRSMFKGFVIARKTSCNIIGGLAATGPRCLFSHKITHFFFNRLTLKRSVWQRVCGFERAHYSSGKGNSAGRLGREDLLVSTKIRLRELITSNAIPSLCILIEIAPYCTDTCVYQLQRYCIYRKTTREDLVSRWQLFPRTPPCCSLPRAHTLPRQHTQAGRLLLLQASLPASMLTCSRRPTSSFKTNSNVETNGSVQSSPPDDEDRRSVMRKNLFF